MPTLPPYQLPDSTYPTAAISQGEYLEHEQERGSLCHSQRDSFSGSLVLYYSITVLFPSSLLSLTPSKYGVSHPVLRVLSPLLNTYMQCPSVHGLGRWEYVFGPGGSTVFSSAFVLHEFFSSETQRCLMMRPPLQLVLLFSQMEAARCTGPNRSHRPPCTREAWQLLRTQALPMGLGTVSPATPTVS